MATKGVGAAVLSGWSLNGIFNHYSGAPFTISAASSSCNCPGNSQVADLVNPNVAKVGSGVGGQAYFDPLAYAPVTGARFGTSGFNQLRGPGNNNLDMSVFRTFRITERFTTQIRAEAMNATNTPHFANPSGTNVSNLQLNGDGLGEEPERVHADHRDEPAGPGARSEVLPVRLPGPCSDRFQSAGRRIQDSAGPRYTSVVPAIPLGYVTPGPGPIYRHRRLAVRSSAQATPTNRYVDAPHLRWLPQTRSPKTIFIPAWDVLCFALRLPIRWKTTAGTTSFTMPSPTRIMR